MYVKHAGKYFATLGLLTVTVRLTALASPIWFSKLRRAKEELRRGDSALHTNMTYKKLVEAFSD